MATDYSHEVGEPKIPQCGTLSLRFNGTSLRMQGGKKEYVYLAVSGMPTLKHLERDRYRNMQANVDIGPIPEGKYWIRLDEIQRNWGGIRRNKASWGNYWVTIHVFPGTETHKRGGFFIHGGKTSGSIGCIDLTDSMDQFVADLRDEAGNKDKCYVPLTVKYR